MDKRILQEIRQTLKDSVDEKTLKLSDHFFKNGEQPLIYGVKMAEVSKIGKEFCNQINDWSKSEIFNLCEELWQSQYFEEEVIACLFSQSQYKKYEPDDFQIFEHWVKNYVNNWADCDTLCNHTIGTFVMMYPDYLNELKQWAKSSARWVKRASAVTLIIPARKGMFLNDIFEIADTLLLDKDDIVQKGYGWLLKATSEAHQKEVFDYVMKNKSVMPRTALRYAIEKMPADLKAEAMKK
ncbi:MAG: DNA alkylation repair protein [Dysgonamonadaceae bacterium]|jgi:3-methyladenine DNA glycosylase AlkD|nr:DNA alkylation repair protein [Dysgonamonadaceae bacterium]